MILSNAFSMRGALSTVLFIVALVSGGCSDKVADPGQLIADAKAALAEQDHNTAIIHLRNLLQSSPEHAEARYILGKAYNDTGYFESAEWELRKALQLQYDRIKVIPQLGKSLLMRREFQAVLDEVHLAEGGADNQSQAEVLTLRALASLGLGQNREGRELLKQALAKQPELADALLGQARLAASEQNLDEATRLTERALASEPENGDVWFMMGELSRFKGDREAAIVAYQRVLEISPRNMSARMHVASLLTDDGNFDEARVQLKKMREIAPANPMAFYVEALIEFRQRNYAAARDAVRQVLKDAPGHIASLVLAGAIELALDSYAQAQSYLSRVIDNAPDNLAAQKLMIAALVKSGQVDRAREVLEPALKRFPEDGVLTALAGEVYLHGNDFAKAARYYEKAAALDPENTEARTKLGMSRLAMGETEHALTDLAFASRLDSDAYQADILLVTSQMRLGNFEQALKALHTLEKKQPDNPLTYNLKGMIYVGKKDIPNARKYLEHALELQATYVPAAANLAQLDLQEERPTAARGRFELILENDKENVQALLALARLGPRIDATRQEQIAWLERARDADSDSVQPQLMLARVYARAGDTKKALEAAERAQKISPENFEVLDIVGAMQIATGRKHQALTTYRKLTAINPESATALFGLANAQVATGNQAGAASTLKKALLLDPEFVDAQAALAELEVRAGRYAEAKKIARQIQKRAATSSRGFLIEGDVLMAEKKYAQSARAYQTAYGIEENDMLAIKMHAAHARAGNAAEADKILMQLLTRSPEDARVRLYAAEVALNSEAYPTAIEHYEWLLQKQPDNVLVLNNVAWVYQQVGRTDAALETAERAYALNSKNAAIADTLGWVLVEQGNVERGLDLLQTAVELEPDAHEIRYHLAQAWLKAGDKAKARSELEKLFPPGAKFPQKGEAMDLLAELKT